MEDRKNKMIDIYKKHTMVEMRTSELKNKEINPVQITAEQIIADPEIHQLQSIEIPTQKYMGDEEISDYKKIRRKKFEDSLRKQRHHIGKWIEYAEWESQLQEFQRARSIFERALDVDPYKISLWIRYAQNEMKNNFFIHARNIWERSVKILPRVEQLWFKYIEMETVLCNYKKCLDIYQRWIDYAPSKKAWDSYIAFTEKLGEKLLTVKIHYKLLESFPVLSNYIKVAKYEYRNRNIEAARLIFERALEELGENSYTEKFFVSWCNFEIKCKEIERAREIYYFALKCLEGKNKDWVESELEKFERQYGIQENVENLLLNKRRKKYQDLIQKDNFNYDYHFNLIFLEEEYSNYEEMEKCYINAISNTPQVDDKQSWKRYIYLCLSFAIFLELKCTNKSKAIQIMENLLEKILNYKNLTFSKVWIYLAKLYIRNKEIDKMRKLMGKSIGVVGKKKIIDVYIEIEYQMGCFDRCRKIHQKKIELFSNESDGWIIYANFEEELSEIDRARDIYKEALKFEIIDNPEKIWKSYIDFEIRNEEYDKARYLYEELLLKTQHIKVFVSYALFEYSLNEFEKMKLIFIRGDNYFKNKIQLKEERCFLIENWLECMKKIGNQDEINLVLKIMPTKIKNKKNRNFG